MLIKAGKELNSLHNPCPKKKKKFRIPLSRTQIIKEG